MSKEIGGNAHLGSTAVASGSTRGLSINLNTFTIESIVYGFGRECLGVILPKNIMYERGRIDGGRESFHPIDAGNLRLFTKVVMSGGSWQVVHCQI